MTFFCDDTCICEIALFYLIKNSVYIFYSVILVIEYCAYFMKYQYFSFSFTFRRIKNFHKETINFNLEWSTFVCLWVIQSDCFSTFHLTSSTVRN